MSVLHFVLILVALVVSGCAYQPQMVGDLVRSEYPTGSKMSGVMPEHPYLSQVAVNLPPAKSADVFEVSVPRNWYGDLSGGTFTDEVSTKKVRLERRYAFRAETCIGQSLACKTSAIVEDGKLYVFLTHSQSSATILSARGKALRISRENAKKLSRSEKETLWGLIKTRSGDRRLVLRDDETGEVFTVIPLGSEYLQAAGITGAALRWQKEAVCGWRSIGSDELLSIAAAPVNPIGAGLTVVGRGMKYYCSKTMPANVLSTTGRNPGGEQ